MLSGVFFPKVSFTTVQKSLVQGHAISTWYKNFDGFPHTSQCPSSCIPCTEESHESLSTKKLSPSVGFSTSIDTSTIFPQLMQLLYLPSPQPALIDESSTIYKPTVLSTHLFFQATKTPHPQSLIGSAESSVSHQHRCL
jgi:hypothetical protein